MQHHFVGAGSAGFPGPSNYLVTPDVPGPEAVVVEQEQRRDQNRPGPMFNHWVGILRGENSVDASNLDELLVERDAAKSVSRVGSCPEFVVSGNPDDLAEFRSQLPKAPVEPPRTVGNVSR